MFHPIQSQWLVFFSSSSSLSTEKYINCWAIIFVLCFFLHKSARCPQGKNYKIEEKTNWLRHRWGDNEQHWNYCGLLKRHKKQSSEWSDNRSFVRFWCRLSPAHMGDDICFSSTQFNRTCIMGFSRRSKMAFDHLPTLNIGTVVFIFLLHSANSQRPTIRVQTAKWLDSIENSRIDTHSRTRKTMYPTSNLRLHCISNRATLYDYSYILLLLFEERHKITANRRVRVWFKKLNLFISAE